MSSDMQGQKPGAASGRRGSQVGTGRRLSQPTNFQDLQMEVQAASEIVAKAVLRRTFDKPKSLEKDGSMEGPMLSMGNDTDEIAKAAELLKVADLGVKEINDALQDANSKLDKAAMDVELWRLRAEEAGYKEVSLPSEEDQLRHSVAEQSRARKRGYESKAKELQIDNAQLRRHIHEMREEVAEVEGEMSGVRHELHSETQLKEAAQREVWKHQDMAKKALDTIQRQKAEIEALKETNKLLEGDLFNLRNSDGGKGAGSGMRRGS
mmetsp:Transcript_33817/g.85511  ORF Transcript_33817/g.85511 Transcript_33817/m.85511 type:complete len:265 (+) Transcript_33817:218-1012(+)